MAIFILGHFFLWSYKYLDVFITDISVPGHFGNWTFEGVSATTAPLFVKYDFIKLSDEEKSGWHFSVQTIYHRLWYYPIQRESSCLVVCIPCNNQTALELSYFCSERCVSRTVHQTILPLCYSHTILFLIITVVLSTDITILHKRIVYFINNFSEWLYFLFYSLFCTLIK